MEKKSDERVNQWILSGALAGISAASATALLRKLRHMKDIRETYGDTETGADAVVVTLPRREKPAEDLKVVDKGETGASAETPKQPRALDSESGPRSETDAGTSREAESSNGQQRRVDGTYGVKYAQETGPAPAPKTGRLAAFLDPKTGGPLRFMSSPKQGLEDWEKIVLGTVGFIGAGYGSYRIADHIHRKRRLKQLERELDAARQHYVSRLYGGGDTKAAQEFKPGAVDVGLATLTLYMLGVGGGTAYLTKRWLDERSRDRESLGLDIPSPPRIVFRTEPMSDSEKKASGLVEMSEAEAELVKAAVGFYVDMLGDRKVIGSDGFRESVEKSGHTVEGLVKLAQQPGALSPDLQADIYKHRRELAGVVPPLSGGLGALQWAQRSRIPVIGGLARWFTGGILKRRLADPEYMQGLLSKLDPRTWREQSRRRPQPALGLGERQFSSLLSSTVADRRRQLAQQKAQATAGAEEKTGADEAMTKTVPGLVGKPEAAVGPGLWDRVMNRGGQRFPFWSELWKRLMTRFRDPRTYGLVDMAKYLKPRPTAKEEQR